MNYSYRYCQFEKIKIFIFLLIFPLIATQLISCASHSDDEAPKNAPITFEAKPVWFNGPERFHYRNRNYDIETHAFFDLAPLESNERKELSYVLLTPKESEFGYDIDLKSGQLFKKYQYCPQNDVWKTYPEKIERPPYTEGFIPRLMDQFGRPMRVFIFGDKSFFVNDKKEVAFSQRARIVGGVVQQYCHSYPCAGREKWLSTMVMIGVVPFDPKMRDVNNIEELKKKVDWNAAKAFMENGYGRKLGPPRDEPVYRVISEVSTENAWKYGFEKGHLFQMPEMNTIRSSCYKLYDSIWIGAKRARIVTEESNINKQDIAKRAKEIEELKNDFTRMTVINDTYTNREEEKLEYLEKVQKKEMNFGDFFKTIYFDYGDRLKTCFQYVRPANLVHDPERHWFFVYIESFLNVEQLGNFYMCSRKAWVENPIINNGKRTYNKNLLKNCTGTELDLSFDSSITFLTGLKRSNREHYRFIEDDIGIGGSHQKIQSWVYLDGKKLSCEETFRTASEPLIFPEDIRWSPFYNEEILRKDGYIR